MGNAETLRRAAVEMREAAQKAEQGRWKLWGMTVMADPTGTSNVGDAIEVARPSTPSWCDRVPRTWNGSYICGMDPAVALAVADWLDVVASRDPTGQSVEAEPAIAVARTYLRES